MGVPVEANALVSYWEWFKLAGTAFLMSCALTAAGFTVWLLVLK